MKAHAFLPRLWYPLLLGAAVSGFAGLLWAGAPAAWAAYPPIVLVALAILGLEFRFPERPEWRPRAADVRVDAAFMALVQVVQPRVLAALALQGWVLSMGPRHSAWWPHGWPLAAQVVAMVLAVDLLRYGLHRACHGLPWLWRLHEVHHSPRGLYALNVGRFHPLEKLLHFGLDTLPFLWLGVAPEVVAGYFVLYSVNGFFQHSNLRLRHGWLNWVVATAEMHRRHHARDPALAACNFSSTTLVWDWVFGTRRLPTGPAVSDIGLMDAGYPQGFWGQMAAPWRTRDRGPVPGAHDTAAWWVDALVTFRLRLSAWVHGWRAAALARDPMRVQRELLARLLKENRDTDFGRRHGFAGIDGPEAFARQVPVCDFEGLRGFVDSEIESGVRALTAQPPLRYARTSGTTGHPKDLPLTAAHLRALRRIHGAAVAFQYRRCPEAFAGAILAIVSPADEGRLANGKPFGSASGVVAGQTPRWLTRKFVVPPAVMAIADSHVKYLLILRLALARRDLSYLGTANPTTVLLLGRLYRAHHAELIGDLRQGGFFLAERVPAEVWRELMPRLAAWPARADELAGLQARPGGVRLADLWPGLRLVVTWTCASAGVAADALRRELSSTTRILELGYVCSEFRGTVTIGRRNGTGLPTLDTHYFEFAERGAWERGEPEFVTLDRLRKGVEYHVVVTTPSGLYRYAMNDVVKVRGFFHKTPLLQFMQKGQGVTNLTGEKLHESQVLAAVRAVLSAHGLAAEFVMMLADEGHCRYRLHVEASGSAASLSAPALARAVDARLAASNIEYRDKRGSGRLGAIEARWLRTGTGEAHKRHAVGLGQREGQFKTVALGYLRDGGFDLAAHVEGG